jgi:hypothetical protein
MSWIIPFHSVGNMFHYCQVSIIIWAFSNTFQKGYITKLDLQKATLPKQQNSLTQKNMERI